MRKKKKRFNFYILLALLVVLIFTAFLKRDDILSAMNIDDVNTNTVEIKDEPLIEIKEEEREVLAADSVKDNDAPEDKVEPVAEEPEEEQPEIKSEEKVEPVEEKKEEPKPVEVKSEEVKEEKPVAAPVETKPQKVSSPVKSEAQSNYSELSNESQGWWFIVPKPLNQDVKADIDTKPKELMAKYNGIWQKQTDEKVVYLTMDCGYEYKDNTSRILDTALEKNVKITFFITGQFIKEYPDLVKRMYNEGHIIGNHSNKHKNEVKALASGYEVLSEDLLSLEKMYKDLIGTDISSFMRPPEGVYSERTLAVIKDLGYRPVFWSFAYRDWETDKQPSEKDAMDKIMGQIHPGSVLLLHTVSKTNTDILGDLVDNIRDRGYRIGTLNEI